MKKYLISASILAANHAILGSEITNVIDAGADWIHFDVMDNHYVPNLSFGAMVCASLKSYISNNIIDVHLMVTPVDETIKQFAQVGVDIITIHPETSLHLNRSIELIKSYGIKVGIALNPSTSLTFLDYILDQIDLILIMSVNPGFGGQCFIKNSLDKITDVRKLIDRVNNNIYLQVDGGVNEYNIQSIAKAGADCFVMGNAIFKHKSYKNQIKLLKQSLNMI